MPKLKSTVLMLYFHTSSTNGVLARCPLAAMVFLPFTNFFAACKRQRERSFCSSLSFLDENYQSVNTVSQMTISLATLNIQLNK